MKANEETAAASGVKLLNLQAIDVCNSRCVMCNVWKDGRRETMSLDELGEWLRQPFFASVEHVGVTGGEPTLRKDLVALYRLLAECLPQLKGASFISHGMQTERIVAIYSEIHALYASLGLQFQGMISLDGVGRVHDAVRGRAGAFDAASRTLLALKERGVNVIAACTIVRENVYGLHDLLEWGQQNGVYVRFRVAEFVNRLYNDTCADQIRNFSPQEIRHLVCFFFLLITEYEKDEGIRRTYQSILSILTGGERLIGCPYQRGEALNVSARGELAACAPKGVPFMPDFASLTSPEMLSRAERERIVRDHCSACIHDYHDGWSEKAARQREAAHLAENELYAIADGAIETREAPVAPLDLASMRRLMLVGWYGTETAGDIAIIRGIISEYLRENDALAFWILSLYPHYTRTTVAEWPDDIRARVKVADYVSGEALLAAHDCDAVVMAGGPLMDIHETGKILRLFDHFARAGKPRVIEGCGVGPLNNEDLRWNVCRIARLATRIRVRDCASRDLLRRYGIRKPIEVRPDPAHTYIQELGLRHHGRDGKVIRCFLRELTSEYPQAISPEQATANLKGFLRRVLEWYPEHRIELWAMHHFPVGKDDRLFAREIVREIQNPRLTFDWVPRAPREILEAMAAAEFCVCMRFHSCVFASGVGSPFLAIDYTAGGKIAGFLDDTRQIGRICALKDLEQLDHGGFEARIRSTGSSQEAASLVSSGRPLVLHLIQQLGGGGAARAMISVAKHSRLTGGPDHALVSLRPADEAGRALARDANLTLFDAPPRRALHRALSEADIVLVHWWNYPEVLQLFATELPPMRLMAWIHVGGYHAPYILTREFVEFVDFAAGCSEHTCRHPALKDRFDDAGEPKTGLIFASADFERIRSMSPRPHEGFRIGYIGTPDPTKMHPHFIRMSSGVQIPGVKFVIYGGGSTEWLKDDADQRGCGDRFEFAGAVEDIAGALETMNVYGYPLCEETYAAAELNIQEVMYAGIPIVAFPHGGIPDLIRHNETGLLVNSEEEYARALEFLYHNPQERERLGRNAARFARAHWGADKMGTNFNRCFERLLKQPKRTRRWASDEALLVSGELPRALAMHPGARFFIESLGEAGEPYRRSVLGETDEILLAAEEQISNQPLLMFYSCAYNFAPLYPNDRYIELWSGLGYAAHGKHAEAFEAFGRSARAGLTHWRISWYCAQSARALGRLDVAAAELLKVLQAVPTFQAARRLQSELPMPKVLPVQAEIALRHTQEAQRLIAAGQFGRARAHLEAASKILPDEMVILELIADMDCRLGKFETAGEIVAKILQRDPKRMTPRLAKLRATLFREGAKQTRERSAVALPAT